MSLWELHLCLKALKGEVILRQERKTFIVYERGVTQVLSEKEQRGLGFEVSMIIIPPGPLRLSQQAAGLGNCSL